jgi:stage V sporulation protein AD
MKHSVLRLNASVTSASSVVGYLERSGPIGHCFDFYDDKKDGGDRFGQDTFEKAESEMQRIALNGALAKKRVREEQLGAIFAGDLLNQCTSSAYGLLDFDVPYFGLYGACSTAAEGLLLAGVMVTSGMFDFCAAVASSHNCTAERQYRTPLEYGGQRTPTAQWTVTGAGAFLVGKANQDDVRLTAGLPGIAIEKGITDTNNMGAAMAPAAADTLLRFLRASQTSPKEYDVIVTGDLGYEGGAILCELMEMEGYDISKQYQDCGQMIFTKQTQDTHAGGSGCGCSAVVMASYFLPKLLRGEIKNMIFMGTGAMMSPTSIQQGMAIPGIAHLLVLESPCRVKKGIG